MRIAPNEVHLSSPENYDKIYGPGGRKYDKDPGFYGILNTKFAMFSTVSSDVHRPRRARLDPFFSRRTVLTMEEAVQDKVAKLCRRVEDAVFSHRGQQEPFNLHAAMRALSIDVITEYAFDDFWGHLDRDDLGEWYPEMVKNIGATMWALQQFPFVLTVVEAIPPQIARKLDPVMRDMLDCKDVSDMILGPDSVFVLISNPHVENKAGGRERAAKHRQRVQAPAAHHLPRASRSPVGRAGASPPSLHR